jgi:glycerophosphoryl diester phosphodiesterase
MYNFLHDMHWVLPLRSAWATPIAEAFTFLGYTPFFLIFLPLIYWFWDRALFIRLAVVIVLNSLLNDWLKDFWQDPRPALEFQLDHARVADSYGRPSGHAQGAAIMWLWLAHELKRGWAWPVAVFIALGVGLSRLYLGVHDIDDVLTGFALGIAVFLVMLVLFTPRFDWWRNLPVWTHFAALAALAALVLTTWPLPRYPDGAVQTLLFLASAYLGYVIDMRLEPRALQRPAWWIGVPAAIAAIIVLFLVRAGVGYAVLAVTPDKYIAGDFQAVAVGLYVTLAASVAFRALGVLRPKD